MTLKIKVIVTVIILSASSFVLIWLLSIQKAINLAFYYVLLSSVALLLILAIGFTVWNIALSKIEFGRFSLGFQRTYYRYLSARYSYLDTRRWGIIGVGFFARLQDMFVEPTFSVTHANSLGLQVGDLTFPELLAKMDEFKRLVILGGPGSGKSVLLNYILLTQTGKAAGRKRHSLKSRRVPIFLNSRDIVDAVNQGADLPLYEVVQKRLEIAGLKPPQGWFEKRLRQGNCIVLIDGLDEAGDPKLRSLIAGWTQVQMESYSKSQFIVGSRPHGYVENPLGDIVTVSIDNFSYEQTQEFIKRWYLAEELARTNVSQKSIKSTRARAEERSNKLWHRLSNSKALSYLARSPLLLVMIISVSSRFVLRERRAELYEDMITALLRGYSGNTLSEQQTKSLLQEIAYWLMSNYQIEFRLDDITQLLNDFTARINPSLSPNELFKSIAYESGLLIEVRFETYAFTHTAFQEYLAARYFRDHGLEAEIIKRIDDNWWYETISLYAAQVDGSGIIEACLGAEQLQAHRLMLATTILGEAISLTPEVRKKIEQTISNAVDTSDDSTRQIAAKASLATRLHTMQPVGNSGIYYSSLISKAEYELFVNQTRATEACDCRPVHWLRDHYYSKGEAYEPVTGIRYKDGLIFCQWLTAQDISRSHYRLPSTGDNLDQIKQSLGDKRVWVSRNGKPTLLGADRETLDQAFELDFELEKYKDKIINLLNSGQTGELKDDQDTVSVLSSLPQRIVVAIYQVFNHRINEEQVEETETTIARDIALLMDLILEKTCQKEIEPLLDQAYVFNKLSDLLDALSCAIETHPHSEGVSRDKTTLLRDAHKDALELLLGLGYSFENEQFKNRLQSFDTVYTGDQSYFLILNRFMFLKLQLIVYLASGMDETSGQLKTLSDIEWVTGAISEWIDRLMQRKTSDEGLIVIREEI